jgi:cell division protein ZapA
MPLVNVMINQRSYTVACDEGEQEHLQELAAHVDAKVHGLLESVGQAGEQRLLVMAALLIADEYFEAEARLEKRAGEVEAIAGVRDEITTRFAAREREAVAMLETAAKQVEDIAARLGRA